MFEPLFTPLFSSLFSPLIAAAQRIFITADPVLETHFPLENTKTLTGDFRVGALCVLPTAATTVTLHGQLASVSNYFKVLSTGFASISIGGSVVTSTVLATKDRKFRIYDVELSGNDFLFQENGVTIDTVTDAGAAANSLVIDVLCQSNGADFFDGIYADPKITDITTPSNSESWKINRAFPATTEQSSSGNNILTYNNAPDSTRELLTFIDGRWKSVQLWTFGDYTYNGSEGGFSSLIGDGALSDIIAGRQYEWNYRLTIVGVAETRLRIGGVTVSNQSVSGVFSGDSVANAAGLFFQNGADASGSAGTTIKDTSVKRFIEVA